ncbi:MAG: BRCT domain-containing protein [Hyphomonadaceae bacterium]
MGDDDYNEAEYNRMGRHRISARQIDELIGLARGLCADGSISEADVDCLRIWLAAQAAITEHPMLRILQERIEGVLADGIADEEERADLCETLRAFTGQTSELGEAMKPTGLPLCDPTPALSFAGHRYCLTGTFLFGRRAECEAAVEAKGAEVGSLTRKTNVLVVGAYATESWKHSSFGNKIMKAVEYRELGLPIRIVSEAHWRSHL